MGEKKWVLSLYKTIMFYSSFGSSHSSGMWGEWCQLFHLSWSKRYWTFMICTGGRYWTFMICLALGKPSGRSPGSWLRALEIRSLLRQAASMWMWREFCGAHRDWAVRLMVEDMDKGLWRSWYLSSSSSSACGSASIRKSPSVGCQPFMVDVLMCATWERHPLVDTCWPCSVKRPKSSFPHWTWLCGHS